MGPRDRRRFDVDRFEVAETLQTLFGPLDLRRVDPSTFQLPHFAAKHFVSGLELPLKLTRRTYAAAWVNEEREFDSARIVIDVRHRVHVHECIPFFRRVANDERVSLIFLREKTSPFARALAGSTLWSERQSRPSDHLADAELLTPVTLMVMNTSCLSGEIEPEWSRC